MENTATNTEQAADLAVLQAAANDAMPDAPADAAPVASKAETWAILPAMVGSMLAIAMPELKAVYTPEACQAWGEAMVPVAEEQGWNAEDVLGPKMALAVASAPFVLGTAMAFKARKADTRTNPAPDATPVAPGASNKSIVFGSPDAAPTE